MLIIYILMIFFFPSQSEGLPFHASFSQADQIQEVLEIHYTNVRFSTVVITVEYVLCKH